MKQSQNQLGSILYKQSTREWCLSALYGLSAGTLAYLGFYQRHYFSKTYLAYAILIAIFFVFISGWVYQKMVKSRLAGLGNGFGRFAWIFSISLSLMLLANIQIHPLYYLLPDKHLEIQIEIPPSQDPDAGVQLMWVKSGQGFVRQTDLEISGKWARPYKETIFEPGQSVSITWTGKVGLWAEVAFLQTENDQQVVVTWDGVSGTHQLNDPDSLYIVIRNHFPASPLLLAPFTLAYLFFTITGLFGLMVILGTIKVESPGKIPQSRFGWLSYAAPMLLVWGFTLLVFWPGIMSNDSMFQWMQGVNGQFNDWQSAFHALLLALLMRIWNSPGFVSTLQVLSLAFTVAYGLKVMQDYGTPRLWLWLISILFAILPTHAILSVTIWKDIPYAIAFIWFTILYLCIAFSQGQWIAKGWNWVLLGIAAFLVSAFRQNGLPIMALSLFVLPIIYQKHWKRFLTSILLASFLYLGMKGPLYRSISVANTDAGQSNLILLHHIAAHIDSGTEITQEERNYLEGLLPLEKWNYSCCYVGGISYQNQFDRSNYLANSSMNRTLAYGLFKRQPGVDIAHTLCSGEMAWRFNNNSCYIKSTHGFNEWGVPGDATGADWIIPNDIGIIENSKLPSLVGPYMDWLRSNGFAGEQLAFYLKPGFFLFLTLFSAAVVIVRHRQWKLALVALPVVAQAGLLFLITFAPAYRYHFGTCLSGLLLLALLWPPARAGDPSQQQSTDS